MTTAFTPIMSDKKIAEHLTACGIKRFCVVDGNVITKSHANALRICRCLIGYGVSVWVK
jgi:hypothetical protein